MENSLAGVLVRLQQRGFATNIAPGARRLFAKAIVYALVPRARQSAVGNLIVHVARAVDPGDVGEVAATLTQFAPLLKNHLLQLFPLAQSPEDDEQMVVAIFLALLAPVRIILFADSAVDDNLAALQLTTYMDDLTHQMGEDTRPAKRGRASTSARGSQLAAEMLLGPNEAAVGRLMSAYAAVKRRDAAQFEALLQKFEFTVRVELQEFRRDDAAARRTAGAADPAGPESAPTAQQPPESALTVEGALDPAVGGAHPPQASEPIPRTASSPPPCEPAALATNCHRRFSSAVSTLGVPAELLCVRGTGLCVAIVCGALHQIACFPDSAEAKRCRDGAVEATTSSPFLGDLAAIRTFIRVYNDAVRGMGATDAVVDELDPREAESIATLALDSSRWLEMDLAVLALGALLQPARRHVLVIRIKHDGETATSTKHSYIGDRSGEMMDFGIAIQHDPRYPTSMHCDLVSLQRAARQPPPARADGGAAVAAALASEVMALWKQRDQLDGLITARGCADEADLACRVTRLLVPYTEYEPPVGRPRDDFFADIVINGLFDA